MNRRGTPESHKKAEFERMRYFNLPNLVEAACCWVYQTTGMRPPSEMSVAECEELVTKAARMARQDHEDAVAAGRAPLPLPFEADQCEPPAPVGGAA